MFKVVIQHDTAGREIKGLHFDHESDGAQLAVGEFRVRREICVNQFCLVNSSQTPLHFQPGFVKCEVCVNQRQPLDVIVFSTIHLYVHIHTLHTSINVYQHSK